MINLRESLIFLLEESFNFDPKKREETYSEYIWQREIILSGWPETKRKSLPSTSASRIKMKIFSQFFDFSCCSMIKKNFPFFMFHWFPNGKRGSPRRLTMNSSQTKSTLEQLRTDASFPVWIRINLVSRCYQQW